MGERDEARGGGALVTALATSVSSNSTAFGFSISITVAFGVTQSLNGSPTMVELLLYGIGAAVAVGLLEAIVTRGFRRRVGSVPPEVSMLGTSMNLLSVAAAVGTAVGVADLVDGTATWPITGFAIAMVFILAETTEILLAERVQRRRGNPEAERERSG